MGRDASEGGAITARPVHGAPEGGPRLDGAPGGYWRLSMRPLHTLVFLLPWIAAYELGAILYLGSGATEDGAVSQTIRARRILADVFAVFDVGGLHVPAALTVVVLLVWHVLTRDPWRVRVRVLAGMLVESVGWTLPLLVLGMLAFRALSAELGGAAAAAVVAVDGAGAAVAPAPDAAAAGDWRASATIAIGAGIYEELLFRMIGLALVSLVVTDILRRSERTAKVVGVLVTSLLFALYHDLSGGGGGIDWASFVFFFLAGGYFAVLYLLRGFGVVAATHALYDVCVLVRPFG